MLTIFVEIKRTSTYIIIFFMPKKSEITCTLETTQYKAGQYFKIEIATHSGQLHMCSAGFTKIIRRIDGWHTVM